MNLSQRGRMNAADLRCILDFVFNDQEGWQYEGNAISTKWSKKVPEGWFTVTVLYNENWSENDFIIAHIQIDEGRVVVGADSYSSKMSTNAPRKMLIDFLAYQLDYHGFFDEMERVVASQPVMDYLHGMTTE